MQPNNICKETKDSTQLIQSKISEQINTPDHSLIKISLEKKAISHRTIKNNKPKQVSKIDSQNNFQTENKILTCEIQLNRSNKISENNANKFKEGPWTNEEHEKFIEGILKYGNQWKNVQLLIRTRSSTQVRTHAQKFFKKIKNLIKRQKENIDINEKIKLINNIFNIVLPNKVNKINKNDKKKLLNAIFLNINSDENLDLKFFSEIDLDDLENLYNENKVIKNNKISLNLFNSNTKKKLSKKKLLIGEKRKLDNIIESKETILCFKKDESDGSTFDFYFNKLNDLDNNEYLDEFLGIYENDITIQKNDNNNNINNNYEKNYITNNFININNNIINNKIVYNIFNQEIFNNNISNLDLYNNDKNDSIYNENIQYFLGNTHIQEKYNFNDKSFLNGIPFNYENETENNNEIDPFQIKFKDLSYEKLFNNEDERQMSIHEYNLV